MTFSVIIPTYNRAHIIQDTVRSVLCQTYKDYEVIVVDDGSTDNTREKIEILRDSRLHYYYKTNGERSVARNFGAERATGKYLIFLDSADRMRADHLGQIYQYLIQTSFGPLFLFSGFSVCALRGETLYQYKQKGIFNKKKLIYGNHLGCSAVTVEAELFRRHRFNTHPDIILFEDWELWLRLLSQEQLHCIPAGSIEMLNHQGRSVLNCHPEDLARKVSYFIQTASRNIPMIARSDFAKRRLAMGLYSYVALHTSLTGKHRATVLRYLKKALGSDPALVTKRRFYAIIRQLIF